MSGVLKTRFPESAFRLVYLGRHWEYVALLLVGLAGWIVAFRRSDDEDPLRTAVGLFTVAGLTHLGYTLVPVSGGVFPWHYVSSLPAGLLGLGYSVVPVVRGLGST